MNKLSILARLVCALLILVTLSACATPGRARDGSTAGTAFSHLDDGRALPIAAALYVVSLPIEGLNQLADWKRVDTDRALPWVGPGQRVAAYERKQLPNFADLDRREYRWQLGDQAITPVPWARQRYGALLRGHPATANWPEVNVRGGWLRRDQQVTVPADRVIVLSLNPDIIVLDPLEGVPAAGSRHKHKPGTVPPITLLSSFRHQPGQRWLALHGGQAAQPLHFDEKTGLAVLRAGNVELHCQFDGEGVDCQRTGPGGIIPATLAAAPRPVIAAPPVNAAERPAPVSDHRRPQPLTVNF